MANRIDEIGMDQIQNSPEEVLALEEASITMAELRRSSSKHIYVVNSSDFNGTEQKGEIALKFLTDAGRQERVKVPDTWVPYDITQFYDKEQWIKDVGLNNTVNKGYLTIIDPEVAEAVLETSEAKEELRRVVTQQRKLAGKEAEVRQNTQKGLAEARAKYKATDEVKRINKQSEDTQAKVTPRIMAIMKNPDTEEIQRLSALKNAKSSITDADITYIMTHCGRDMPKIKSWALDLRARG